MRLYELVPPASCWALIVAEAIRPRLGYDVRRCATVFPLGMHPACSFAVGKVTGIAWIALSGLQKGQRDGSG
jgi:hypothetical protein